MSGDLMRKLVALSQEDYCSVQRGDLLQLLEQLVIQSLPVVLAVGAVALLCNIVLFMLLLRLRCQQRADRAFWDAMPESVTPPLGKRRRFEKL